MGNTLQVGPWLKEFGRSETLRSVGVADGDLLMLRRQNSLPQQSSPGIPRDFRANDFASEALANPLLMNQIESTNPQLADAIRSNDLSKVESIVRTTWQSQRARYIQLGHSELKYSTYLCFVFFNFRGP